MSELERQAAESQEQGQEQVGGEVQEQPAPEPNYEELAESEGWRPREEWHGPDDHWVDAKTFVERGREILPIVKAKNARLERELNEMKQAVQQFKGYMEKTEQKAYERAMKDLQAQRMKAFNDGDSAAFVKAEEAAAQLQQEVQQRTQAMQPGEPPVFREWKQANGWYETDQHMQIWADSLGDRLARQGMPVEQVYAEVSRQARQAFPHKFANPARTTQSPVSGSAQPPQKQGKTFNDLPEHAKDACRMFVKQIPGFTREQYVKNYFG